MGAVLRERDFETERRERDRFVVLQHLYTIEEECTGIPVRRIADDLGLSQCTAEEIVEHLIAAGYLIWVDGSACICPSRHGREYIESLAWRRRSLRV